MLGVFYCNSELDGAVRLGDVRRDRLAVRDETLAVDADGVRGHGARLLDRLSLGDTARERRDMHREAPLGLRLEDDGEGKIACHFRSLPPHETGAGTDVGRL